METRTYIYIYIYIGHPGYLAYSDSAKNNGFQIWVKPVQIIKTSTPMIAVYVVNWGNVKIESQSINIEKLKLNELMNALKRNGYTDVNPNFPSLFEKK